MDPHAYQKGNRSHDVVVGLLHQDSCRGLTVEEESRDLLNLVLGNFELAKSLSKHVGWVDQLHDVPQRGPCAYRSKVGQRIRLDLDALRLAPDGQDLDDFVEIVGQQPDDEETIKEIDGDAMR